MTNENKIKVNAERYVRNNVFLRETIQTDELPVYDKIHSSLPSPIWEGHEDAVSCYYKAWEIAFGNIKKAVPGSGFVSHFIDTAFNDCLFMWDSSFILMFGKYARHIFDFQRTLDNFYSHQHENGYICREISENKGMEMWCPDDLSSTGPNVMPWAEWEYWCLTADKQRLSRVFDPLMAYHIWFSKNRTWDDGTYFATGLASGMDNSPRINYDLYDLSVHHGFVSAIDACCQQYLSASILIKMSEILGRSDETVFLKDEAEHLMNLINDSLWDEESGFYYDRNQDGTLTNVKTVASYWALIAGIVPHERSAAFISHLDNESEFKRPCRIPSLSADHPDYNNDTGGYWCGGVWAPTNYMTLKGLEKYGYDKLAYETALDYLNNVVKVYNETGTLYENYSPEKAAKGVAQADFVGWTGLAPISIMIEFVFGIKADPINKKITWIINRLEKHGIRGLRLGDTIVDLICDQRSSADEKPKIQIRSEVPVEVEMIWDGGRDIYTTD